MADVVAWASGAARPRLRHARRRSRTHPGGGGANVAARLAAPGVPTLLVARVGNDLAGPRGGRGAARAAGVELEVAIDPVRADRHRAS